MELTDLYEELTEEELDTLIPFYTNLVPHERHYSTSTMEELGARGLLTIYDRKNRVTMENLITRYWVHLSPRGHLTMLAQGAIQLVLSGVRLGMSSEALEFMRGVPDDLLSELVVCNDSSVRKHARWRLKCAGENGISAP